ncbi:hypothetical protein ZWY2020_048482 [Hordeum vulgare]|nr:hypothetical protein ZWY2020_048482 [Hordeum vulgare]
MAEATTASITLHDLTAKTFKVMLGFLYTDELPAEMRKRGRTTGLEVRTTVVDSASLEFIVDYEQNKHLAVGKAVCSDYISADGHDWKIYCYPRGWVEANNGNSIAVPASDIESHLGGLLDRSVGTDVSFCVKGETFHAHRAILAARSPVFKAELFGPMAEATMACVTLHEIEPVVFKTLLRFVYTNSLPVDRELGDSVTDMVKHLLAAADRYALDLLKLACAQKLWDSVSVDTVADVLACAEIYNCQELKSRCIDFVMAKDNFKKTVLTESFISLLHKFPSIIAELRDKVGS